MELCKGFVCSETLRKLLMRHAQSRFSIFGEGQLPVTCERCNICTVAGEGTTFWNIVRYSFRTSCVSSWGFYKDLCCVKHNQLIFDFSRQKVHWSRLPISRYVHWRISTQKIPNRIHFLKNSGFFFLLHYTNLSFGFLCFAKVKSGCVI